MPARHAIAAVAALLGEPTRAAIVLALLDGSARPAGELARTAQLSAAATSLHLAKLVQGGLLRVRPQGRHRYYRLASVEVAHALEALGAIATPSPPPRALTPARAELRLARSCYDHLAGRIAVDLAELLEREGLVTALGERDYDVTERGTRWFAESLHIDVPDLACGRRALARRCLDWTERRPHLAGALGAALLDHFVAQRWVRRSTTTRALGVTPRGRAELEKRGVRLAG